MSAYPHGNFFFSFTALEFSDKRSVIVQTNDKRPSFSTSKRCERLWLSRGAEGKTGREAVPSTKRRLPGLNWGSPYWSDLWCSVLENQTVETFPCHIFYCLLHLGQGFSFHPMLSVILLLPELLRLGGLQSELGDSCPLTGEARFKSWFWQTSTLLQSP